MSDASRATPHARPRGRAAAEEAIVAAARRLYRERSPAEVTMREIADVAGVNRGLLHHYFGSKEDLLAAIVTTASEQAASGVREAPDLLAALATLRGQGNAYARMVAWALISGVDPDDFARPSPTIAALLEHAARVERAADDAAIVDDRMAVAAALTLVLGWQVFEPFITRAAGLDDMSADERAAQLGRLVDTMVMNALS
jgi:TetR/AcrR family transcriptional regulator, repressor for neighboring sulfatase